MSRLPLTPFDDSSFVNGMEEILKNARNDKNAILIGMETFDKKIHPVKYHTLDCALCYLTYKAIKDDPELTNAVKNLVTRVVENLYIMKNSEPEDIY